MEMALLTCTFLAVAAAHDALAPWASNHHSSDAAKEHVQKVTAPRVDYVVVQGGTMDGRNCRSPQGVWQPFEQTWESNRSVRLENVGETEVINPWLSNGQNDFQSLERIAGRAIEPGMTAADKARALWWQEVQQRFHLEGDNDELLDPVKVLNVYGYNTCGNDSICLAGLWKKAGLKVAPARLVGHCATQVFYDGAWHLLDGDMHSIYLLRDNQTVAGEQDLVRDHDLIRRTHTQGILQPDTRAGDEWESSIYVFEGQVAGDRNSANNTLNMRLRPGEAIVWRWGHLDPVKYHGPRPPRFADRICNGAWEFRPNFSGPSWRDGAEKVDSIQERNGVLRAEAGTTGVVVWRISSPYVIVGGRLDVDRAGVKFSLSIDGDTWTEVEGTLDAQFVPQGPARYGYYLKCSLSGDAELRRLAIVNDLQMAPLTLPGMSVGVNSFTYTDESPGERQVRVSHKWVERSANRPPHAPTRAEFPPDGGDCDGTSVAFRWLPAVDPDGDAIADYHFELSSRADMKWPLSMSFAKLISRTADAGHARYTLPEPGLLNPNARYFWHVRAKDDKGVWGPWSETWSFTPRGPAPPQEVRMEVEQRAVRGVLRWTPNALGRQSVKYRIFASDEKGFSISDKPYKVTVGVSKDLNPEFRPNFMAETKDTKMEVVGPNVEAVGANKAFYRVVAVDADGVQSGPSDYAACPRPLIVSLPTTTAKQGAEYRYRAAVVRSLGDLRTRVVDGKEVMNFWDIERPYFELKRGPSWLSLDAETGLLSGTPDRSGPAEIVVSVTLRRDERRLDEQALRWGVEKVIDAVPAKPSSVTQSFTIDVLP